MLGDSQLKHIINNGVFSQDATLVGVEGNTLQIRGVLSVGTQGREVDGRMLYDTPKRFARFLTSGDYIKDFGVDNLKGSVLEVGDDEYKIYERTGHDMVTLHMLMQMSEEEE